MESPITIPRNLAELIGRDPNMIIPAFAIQALLEVWKGHPIANDNFSDLNGAEVLDLGCGSRYRSPEGSRGRYPPNFCLMTAANGAITFGIDIKPAAEQDGSAYTHIQEDLVTVLAKKQLHNIPQIRNRQFDIIHCANLLDANNHGANPDPNFEDSAYMNNLDMQSLANNLIAEIPSILKPDGVFVLDQVIYRLNPDNPSQLKMVKRISIL